MARESAEHPASDLQTQDSEERDFNQDAGISASAVSPSSSASASSSPIPKPASTGGAASGEALPSSVQRIGNEDALALSVPEAKDGGEADSAEKTIRDKMKPLSTGTGEGETERTKFDVAQCFRFSRPLRFQKTHWRS